MAKVKEKEGSAPPDKDDEKISRRNLIKTGAAAALGAAVTAALPGMASAADGDSLKIGESNEGASTTNLSSNVAEDTAVLSLNNQGGNGMALSTEGPIWANARKPGVNAVVGAYFSPSGNNTRSIGVWGAVLTEDGEEGSDNGAGVWGTGGVHVRALGDPPRGTGVAGDGSKVGVFARSKKRALDVKGKAHFSNSGHTFVGPKNKTKKVKNTKLNIGKKSLILVTLQGSAGPNVVVQFAKRLSKTSFRIYLNKKAKKRAKLAYFIVN